MVHFFTVAIMALSVIFMAAAPDIHQLVQQVAVLGERMKSIDASYDQGWTLLREDIAKRDAMRAEEMAKRETERAEEMAKRDAMRAEEMARRDVEFAKRETERTEAQARRDVELARRDLANTRWLVGTIAGATVIIIGATALLTAG